MFLSRTHLLFCFLLLLYAHSSQAQVTLHGQITSKQTSEALLGVTVVLYTSADTSFISGSTTDELGYFRLPQLPAGAYLLQLSSVGYEPQMVSVTLAERDQYLNQLQLEEAAVLLEDLSVTGERETITQKGDTLQYKADAYQLNPDATTGELLSKMPGMTVQNGSVTAQGEQVEQVLVDGQTFFGSDPGIALQYLPSYVIDRVEVFDQESEQAQFTGFDDGNTTKTINLVTKLEYRNGTFGNTYTGYGTDERYQAKGNLNNFKEARRYSVLGMANNINEQNFSDQDLLGVLNSNNRSGGGGPGQGPAGRNSVGADNFLVGQQGGINQTYAGGINYLNAWGEKLELESNYFVNKTINQNDQQISQSLLLGEEARQTYEELAEVSSENVNHRLNARLEYTLNDRNSLIYTPRLSLQRNESGMAQLGLNQTAEGSLLNETTTQSLTELTGYAINNSLLWRHAFEKSGRTLSVNLNWQETDRDGLDSLSAITTYAEAGELGEEELIEQATEETNPGRTLGSTLIVTEKVGLSSMLLFRYQNAYNRNEPSQITTIPDPDAGGSFIDTSLSGTFSREYNYQQLGTGLRIRNKGLHGALGLDYQYATLEATNSFPAILSSTRSYHNLLPNLMLIKRGEAGMFMLRYRARTTAPTASQLQPILDNSNPLAISTGNEALDQSYQHTLITRYTRTDFERERTFFAFGYLQHTQNYVGNTTVINQQDTTLGNGLLLREGVQLRSYANLEGRWVARSYAGYGLPLIKLGAVLNLNAGLSWTRTPGLVNGLRNLANTYTLGTNLTLASNASQVFDYTLSYAPDYTIVRNSLSAQSNDNYLQHTLSLAFTWMPASGLVIKSQLAQYLYDGLGGDFDQQYTLWNLSIGQKLLKDDRAELSLSIFDLLGQNDSISRTVTETYIEDSQTQVLETYFMLGFRYDIRQFKSLSR